ncbi:MAG TPA: hypothetical protein PKW98_07990 [Candidatus Wallbacteria bacterium]|nr:hypothetical protein [Candidatus Wallbacteria bacterium]
MTVNKKAFKKSFFVLIALIVSFALMAPGGAAYSKDAVEEQLRDSGFNDDMIQKIMNKNTDNTLKKSAKEKVYPALKPLPAINPAPIKAPTNFSPTPF